jgi:hypothetical protein
MRAHCLYPVPAGGTGLPLQEHFETWTYGWAGKGIREQPKFPTQAMRVDQAAQRNMPN